MTFIKINRNGTIRPQVLKQLEKVTKCLKEAIAANATFCYIDEDILEYTRVMLKTKGCDIPYPRFPSRDAVTWSNEASTLILSTMIGMAKSDAQKTTMKRACLTKAIKRADFYSRQSSLSVNVVVPT